MTRNLVGLIASLALLPGAAALAEDMDSPSQRSTPTPLKPDRADSAQGPIKHGQMKDPAKEESMVGELKYPGGPPLAAPIAATELKGELVKMEGKTLYVKHMGAIVPLKFDKYTRFDDKKDLKEGTEVRASFTVKGKTTNLATSVSTQAGTGGSGPEQGAAVPEGSRFDDGLHGPARPERSPGVTLPEDPGTAPKTPSSGTTY